MNIKMVWRRYRKPVLWGLLVLVVVWSLWYARPVDVHFLLDRQNVGFIEGYVTPQKDFPHPDVQTYSFAVGEPEAEALMEQLEAIRFHRSPLEPLIRLLPPSGTGKTVDPEKDYVFHISFWSKNWTFLQDFEFNIDAWSYGTGQDLPLYVSHAQETGREFGRLMQSLANSKSKELVFG